MQLRPLLDQYIAKPNSNPVTEHRDADMDMSLMIHDTGFLTWHQHFVAELETWLVNNGGARFGQGTAERRAAWLRSARGAQRWGSRTLGFGRRSLRLRLSFAGSGCSWGVWKGSGTTRCVDQP